MSNIIEAGPIEVQYRFGPRLSRTETALIARGINSLLAKRVAMGGYTISVLKQMSDADLYSLGFDERGVSLVRKGSRSSVPKDALLQVLWANRFQCCVCRDPQQPITVHHIIPWAKSHNHSVDNLAVICLTHHAMAHRTGSLEQNLTPEKLKDAKVEWEATVGTLDIKSVLAASKLDHVHWLWFNHRRLIEMAHHIELDVTKLDAFLGAKRAGFVDENGFITNKNSDANYLYEGGYGQYLENFMCQILDAMLGGTSLFNISDDLDLGLLSSVVNVGDLVFVQGKHLFKRKTRRLKGPGQVTEGRRAVNGINIRFVIDLWESISCSAWSAWLCGQQNVGSILWVANKKHIDGKLEIECSCLVIGMEMSGLSRRSYMNPSCPRRDMWGYDGGAGDEDWGDEPGEDEHPQS